MILQIYTHTNRHTHTQTYTTIIIIAIKNPENKARNEIWEKYEKGIRKFLTSSRGLKDWLIEMGFG